MTDKQLQGMFIGLTCAIAALYREHPDPSKLTESLKEILSQRIESETDPEISRWVAAFETHFHEALNQGSNR